MCQIFKFAACYSPEKLNEPPIERLGLLKFTFPDHEHVPAQRLKSGDVLAVALGITGDLRRPVVAICLGSARAALAAVAMPEAPVHDIALRRPMNAMSGVPGRSAR